MADDSLASELQNGGFAKFGEAASGKTGSDAVKSASDAIGNVGSQIQKFYKHSTGQDSKGMKTGTTAAYAKKNGYKANADGTFTKEGD
jgi:hypothetical protein